MPLDLKPVKKGEPLVSVRDLTMHFPIYKGVLRRQVGSVKAVDGVSFDILAGETLGLVGESGCGKSTTGRVILRLYTPTAGSIVLEGRELTTLEGETLRALRPEMQMIFQDPQACLNPRMTVGSIIAEPLDEHRREMSKKEKQAKVRELLAQVGMNPDFANRYPHEFSGGQRQRIGIARAVALNPDLVVCDEAVAALDVSVQAQVLNLLRELQREHDLAYLFISHDLAVVRHVAHAVAVMYLGEVVERGTAQAVLNAPQHPYTQALLACSTELEEAPVELDGEPFLAGEVPSAVSPPSGCAFHPRCPRATQLCANEAPPEHAGVDGVRVKCHFPGVAGS